MEKVTLVHNFFLVRPCLALLLHVFSCTYLLQNMHSSFEIFSAYFLYMGRTEAKV